MVGKQQEFLTRNREGLKLHRVIIPQAPQTWTHIRKPTSFLQNPVLKKTTRRRRNIRVEGTTEENNKSVSCISPQEKDQDHVLCADIRACSHFSTASNNILKNTSTYPYRIRETSKWRKHQQAGACLNHSSDCMPSAVTNSGADVA